MSKRHQQSQMVLPPKVETRAHAHNERHRVHSELHTVKNLVSHGVEPDDVNDPGPGFKPMHHHDAEIGRELSQRQRFRHWKSKAWKRRKVARKHRARELKNVNEQA